MTNKPAETWAGKKPCGCVVWLCSPFMPAHDLALSILEAEKEGLKIELMPTQQAIDAYSVDCKCGNQEVLL